jgi:hypothetical protein
MTLTALSYLLIVVQRPSSRLPLSSTAARPYRRLYDLRIASVVDVVNEFERDVVIDLLDNLLRYSSVDGLECSVRRRL